MTLSEKGEMSHVGSRWLNHPLGSGQVTGNISCVSIIRFDGKEATCSIAPSQDCATWWTYNGQMGWENDMSAHEQAQKPFSNFFSIDAVSIDSYVLFFFKRKLVMTSREVSIATNWKLLLNWLLRWWGSLTGLLWMWQSDGLSKQMPLLMGLLPGGYVICDASRRFGKTFYVVPQGSAKDRQLTHGLLQPFTAMGPEMLPGKPQHTRIRREADAFLFSICLFDWGCFV